MNYNNYEIPRGVYLAEFVDAGFYESVRENTSRRSREIFTKVRAFNYTLRVFDRHEFLVGTLTDGFEIKDGTSPNSPLQKFLKALGLELHEIPQILLERNDKVRILTNITCIHNVGMKAYVEEFLTTFPKNN